MKTKEEIKAEYIRERSAYSTLVGRLYPGIAYDRLMELREKYVEGTDSFWGDLPTVPPPNKDGSVPFFNAE